MRIPHLAFCHVVKPSTLLYFHNLLRKCKYQMLFSPRHGHRPGPKGPEKELIAAATANLASGMSTEAARYAAHRSVGGLEQIKEECGDMRRLNLVEDVLRDFRYSVRAIRRNPGFTTIAVLTLALGRLLRTVSRARSVQLVPLGFFYSCYCCD
jgi:hypothetical protein